MYFQQNQYKNTEKKERRQVCNTFQLRMCARIWYRLNHPIGRTTLFLFESFSLSLCSIGLDRWSTRERAHFSQFERSSGIWFDEDANLLFELKYVHSNLHQSDYSTRKTIQIYACLVEKPSFLLSIFTFVLDFVYVPFALFVSLSTPCSWRETVNHIYFENYGSM